TQNFIVFSDGTPAGDAAARAMLDSAEADYAATQVWFGGLTPPSLPFYVYADPNAGGAYHMTCAGTDVHVLSDPVRAPGFLTAEIVEVFEAAINNGWDCAVTNGESLSRVLAFERHPEIAEHGRPARPAGRAAIGQSLPNQDRTREDGLATAYRRLNTAVRFLPCRSGGRLRGASSLGPARRVLARSRRCSRDCAGRGRCAP